MATPRGRVALVGNPRNRSAEAYAVHLEKIDKRRAEMERKAEALERAAKARIRFAKKWGTG